MNCLLCGAKLAIFRKSSIGDFCSLEHRALYLAEQSGLAASALTRSRVSEGSEAEPAPVAGEPLETQAVETLSAPVSHERQMTPARPFVSMPEAMTHREVEFPEVAWRSAPTLVAPVLVPRRRAVMEPAGFVLPWSSTASQDLTFAFSTLSAAAWARTGTPEALTYPGRPKWPSLMVIPRCDWLEADRPALPGQLPLPVAYETAKRFLRPDPKPRRTDAGTAFDIPEPPLPPPRPAFRDPRMELSASWSRLDTPDPAIREAVPPPAHLILDTSTATPDLLQSLPVASGPSPLTSSRFDEQDDAYRKMTHIPPRNVELTPVQKFLSYMPPAPTLLAIAACGVFAIAAVSFLALPSVANSSPADGFAVNGRLSNFRTLLRGRASIRLQDDFRAGLSAWEGPSGWAKDWSYDQAGSLRPGRFGLWRKSMNLTDYRFEMLGQIERKSMGWVFRAQDAANYYAAKVTISKPGPLPLADFVRYAVTNGRAGAKTAVRLPFAVRNDTIYQVQMDIRGDHFTTKINGRIVDSWVDGSHSRGGVGLLSDLGEQARVRWLRVSHRDDFIGRVCSYLTAEAFIPKEDSEYAEVIQLEDGELLYIR